MDVAAGFLHKRYELSKYILDDELIDKILFSADVKHEIEVETHMKYKNMSVVISNLKKRGFIVKSSNRANSDRINQRFIPRVGDDKNHKLLILFNFDDNRGRDNQDS